MENISLLMKYFKNKKILVTGCAGFIGSHLVKSLVNARAKVSVIVKYNSIINCPRLLNVWDKIKIIMANMRFLKTTRNHMLPLNVTSQIQQYRYQCEILGCVIRSSSSVHINTSNSRTLQSYFVM